GGGGAGRRERWEAGRKPLGRRQLLVGGGQRKTSGALASGRSKHDNASRGSPLQESCPKGSRPLFDRRVERSGSRIGGDRADRACRASPRPKGRRRNDRARARRSPPLRAGDVLRYAPISDPASRAEEPTARDLL